MMHISVKVTFFTTDIKKGYFNPVKWYDYEEL
jgi:hypothetical protein